MTRFSILSLLIPKLPISPFYSSNSKSYIWLEIPNYDFFRKGKKLNTTYNCFYSSSMLLQVHELMNLDVCLTFNLINL